MRRMLTALFLVIVLGIGAGCNRGQNANVLNETAHLKSLEYKVSSSWTSSETAPTTGPNHLEVEMTTYSVPNHSGDDSVAMISMIWQDVSGLDLDEISKLVDDIMTVRFNIKDSDLEPVQSGAEFALVGSSDNIIGPNRNDQLEGAQWSCLMSVFKVNDSLFYSILVLREENIDKREYISELREMYHRFLSSFVVDGIQIFP